MVLGPNPPGLNPPGLYPPGPNPRGQFYSSKLLKTEQVLTLTGTGLNPNRTGEGVGLVTGVIQTGVVMSGGLSPWGGDSYRSPANAIFVCQFCDPE